MKTKNKTKKKRKTKKINQEKMMKYKNKCLYICLYFIYILLKYQK